ncbi:hypothetical protein CALCODRAFT_521886 [Calocera cornea HHB12733]|uniref:Uncharacterized protein n=1 Tax=Calocera cornea HHB12733 TaxID=1353952 RepID=A0A165CCR7_9BASI|nr:hypothetical protein CALCODRAFT_521886 [Calocera cornea HHB12733]
MPASSPPDDISKPSSSTYLGAGATILGLRQRSRFKSSRKYFVRIHIDGKEEWTSREIRTKESKVVWDDDQDRHEFKCSLTSLFRVTLFRNRRGARPSEEIGTLARPLQEWIQAAMVGQLITSSPEKNGLSIEIQMSRMYEDADVPDSTAALQEVVEGLGPVNGLEATANSAVLLTTKESGSDNPTTAISSSGELSNGVADVAGALEGLLETLHMFVRSMDAQTEVHPYLKMAWTILSTALNIAVVQQEHNNKMKLLIEKITMVYGFICDARELRHDKARLGVLSRLALQTVDCAYFISSHIDDTHLVTRLAKQTLFSTDTKIDEYSKSFDYMLQEFRTGSQLRTELATLSMSEGVKELSANASLQNIPFVGGRFLKIKRLGAAFCFTSTPSRKPVDLFRNIAHGLASLDGAFKAALEDAVKDDKDLCQTNDVMRQFDNFILGPAHTLMPHGTIFVMIDAFDESAWMASTKRFYSGF